MSHCLFLFFLAGVGGMSIWDITFWRGGAGYEEGVGTLENNHQISDLHSLWVTEAFYLFLSDTILHAHPWNPCFIYQTKALNI